MGLLQRILTVIQYNCKTIQLIICNNTYRLVYSMTHSRYLYISITHICKIDTGSCKKALSIKHPPKTLGTRISCEIGTALGGAKGKTGMGLDEHRAIHAPRWV